MTKVTTQTNEALSAEMLRELAAELKSENFDEITRWAKTGKLLEEKLQDGPVAIMGTTSMTAMRFKVVKVAVVDWIRLGGTISVDYATPLEALENDGK
jgi:hypothetical protein